MLTAPCTRLQNFYFALDLCPCLSFFRVVYFSSLSMFNTLVITSASLMVLNIGISLSISVTSLDVSLQLCNGANSQPCVAAIFDCVLLLVSCKTIDHTTFSDNAFYDRLGINFISRVRHLKKII